MKTKLVIPTLIFIFLVSIIGCSKLEKENPADYFPVSIGNSWEFQGIGNEYATFNQEVIYQKDDRAQFKINNGATISKAIYKISPDNITRILQIFESYDDENLLEKGFDANDNTIIIKTPLEIGTNWEVPVGTREIVGVESNIITPAGNFTDCIIIKCEFNETEGIMYEYYQKGVGLVKSEYILDDFKIISSLQKYNIN